MPAGPGQDEGTAGYHLFPDFIGGPNEGARQQAIATSRLVLQELMTAWRRQLPCRDAALVRRPLPGADLLLRSADAGCGRGFRGGRVRRLVGADAGHAKLS